MEEFKMKKKTKLTVAAVSLGALMTVGGTLAWFTDTEEVTNVVTMGKVDIALSEVGMGSGLTEDNGLIIEDIMPGDKRYKEAIVENKGNDAYVRAKVIVTSADAGVLNTFVDNDPDNDLQMLDFQNQPYNVEWNHVYLEDGTPAFETVYYYEDAQGEDIFKEGAEEWNPFMGFVIPGSWDNALAEAGFNVKFVAEAVQADNIGSAEEAWAGFEESEHKDLDGAGTATDEKGTTEIVVE